ncbi:MAG: methyltransferase [Planctomycetes bacterium]|nr:methyltransferase [Planctomycetota bacterium]
MTWHRSTVAPDGTHHVVDGQAMYSHRFIRVQKFHEPGLAPVADASGAFHILSNGRAAYSDRFVQAWGFYEGRAAVQDRAGWFHIDVDGRPLTPDRFAWCGNFQGGRCTVRSFDRGYLHLTEFGSPAYAQRYLYAGDFRDGAAVVRCPARGLCTHIGPEGQHLHDKWFIDLDVFHKGFARARDQAGWFHIDLAGRPITDHRYAEVEPFYNGQARVLTHDGEFHVVDQAGQSLATVGRVPHDSFHQVSADLVGHWRTDTIAAAAILGIFEHLPASAATLAYTIGAPPLSVSRLLGGLWELGLVDRQGDQGWIVTDKGRLLDPRGSLQLADAAIEIGGALREQWAHLVEAIRSRDWRPPDVFENAGQDPVRLARVQRMLSAYAQHDYGDIVAHLPFEAAGSIVDVAGGTGVLARMIAARFPAAEVSVLERGEVCAFAQQRRPEGRVRFVGGSIFQRWPLRADAFVMSRVLHDWNDQDAAEILRNARESVERGSIGVILELLLLDSSPFGRLCDLHLMVVTGGRERTGDEYSKLLRDAGFSLVRVQPTNSIVSMLVVEAT